MIFSIDNFYHEVKYTFYDTDLPFQTMLENYTFLPFSVFLAIFWVFTYKKVPETKNKTFDEIATLFKIQNKQK